MPDSLDEYREYQKRVERDLEGNWRPAPGPEQGKYTKPGYVRSFFALLYEAFALMAFAFFLIICLLFALAVARFVFSGIPMNPLIP